MVDDQFRESAYQASPECRARECYIEHTEELYSMRSKYQHGHNPESVMWIDRFSVRTNPAEHAQQQFREFAERCHRHEDGALPADS